MARAAWRRRGGFHRLFDTHAIARQLAGAGLAVDQVDAITDAVRQAAEHDAATVATRSDLSALETRLYRAMLMQTIVTIGLFGLVLGGLRWLG